MVDTKKTFEWDAFLSGGDGDGSGAFVGFPWDTKESFGKANLVPVWAEFDGEPYRGSIANMGSGPCLIVVKSIRDKIGKQAGDKVHVKVWLDTETRVVEPTHDLAQAMAGHAEVRAAWETLAPSHRREYVQWIEGAKKPETRAKRVADALDLIADKRRLK